LAGLQRAGRIEPAARIFWIAAADYFSRDARSFAYASTTRSSAAL